MIFQPIKTLLPESGESGYIRLPEPQARSHGPVAQLGERLHGMQEVVGSIPIGSTII